MDNQATYSSATEAFGSVQSVIPKKTNKAGLETIFIESL
jgi:hypothetical protein